MDNDTRVFITIMLALIGAVIGLAALCMYLDRQWHRGECRTFCEDYGETSYYSPAYGCHCVTPDGRRYNPAMVGKDGYELERSP